LTTPTPEPTTNKPLRDIFTWRPQPRQAEFLKACGVLRWFLYDQPIRPPRAKLMGYGGAAGGGKTDTLLALAIILCFAFPGIRITYFRRKYTELEGPDGAIERSRELFTGIGTYNGDAHRWTFPQVDSRIYFRHCKDERNKYDYQSQQFHVLLVDEATHFPWAIIDYLLTRNRNPKVPGLTAFAVMTSNPGNIGHAWYQTIFDIHDHSGGEDGPHAQVKRRLTPNSKYEMTYFLPALLEDNQVLLRNDPDYERKLEDREGDLAQALRYCNWIVFQGQAFRSFSRNRHVISPRQLPAHWPKWRAVDWGYVKPFCCLWLTRDPDSDRIYVYRELYLTKLTDRQQAKMIRDMTPVDENIIMTYADPSMWETKNREDITYSTADEYAAAGVILSRADNHRIDGKRRVDRLLGDLGDGYPGMMIFETCANLIRTMPLLVYDDTNPEDVNTTQEDHAYDALRYGLSNYQLPSRETSGSQDENPLGAFGGIL
jgi:hypothetical protein